MAIEMQNLFLLDANEMHNLFLDDNDRCCG